MCVPGRERSMRSFMKIFLAALLLALVVTGCGGRSGMVLSEKEFSALKGDFLDETANGKTAVLAKKGGTGERTNVIFLGDSLTAGAGVSGDTCFPGVIGNFWKQNGISYHSVNAGVSGWMSDTTLFAIDRYMTDSTALVFLEIGVNDVMLEHRPVAVIKKNIQLTIDKCRARGIPIVLGAMNLPVSVEQVSNTYIVTGNVEFSMMYSELGKTNRIPVMPFLIKNTLNKDFSMNGDYWQSDRWHPNAKGHRIIAGDVLKFLNRDWQLQP